jgi:hypothetical protein
MSMGLVAKGSIESNEYTKKIAPAPEHLVEYPEAFEKAFELILRHEGGYVNDVDDPGGETKFGISARAHPDVNIKSLLEADAKQIYWEEYWLKYPQFGQISNPDYAAKVFDIGINIGPSKALAFYLANKESIEGFRAVCRAYYQALVKKRPRMKKYLRGWLNRVEDGWRDPLEQISKRIY